MHEVRLHTYSDAHGQAVMAEIDKMDNSARVFRTYVEYEGTEHILVTTSKDTHLTVGALSRDGLEHFCKLLEQECDIAKTREFLLYLQLERKDGLLVTRSMASGGEETYHLSPAR